MTTLEKVKLGLGVFYSDEQNDVNVQNMIDGIKQSMKSSGVPEAGIESPLGIQFIIRWCRKFESSDTTIPVFDASDIAFLTQLSHVETVV